MDLVEKVARAICKSATCEGAACCEWPANNGRLMCHVQFGGYDDAANAAIAVIREVSGTPPSEADMLRLLQASSCFRDGGVCFGLPCACAESLARARACGQSATGGTE